MKHSTVTGIVEHGNGDGRKLGFPTANLRLHEPITIDYGVYAAWVEVDNVRYKSVLHYGPRLVFHESHPLFEVHIIDFEKDIYDKKMTVTLVQFLRGTLPFSSLDALIEQMGKDKQQAETVLTLPSTIP